MDVPKHANVATTFRKIVSLSFVKTYPICTEACRHLWGCGKKDIANLSPDGYRGEGVTSKAYTNKFSLFNQPKILSEPQSFSELCYTRKSRVTAIFKKL